ncbi:MAG: hypothetical protein CEE40_06305 [Chloroflexi bacterium B3_Chlor]|nr:MAG: hypothetical protein CEE40_06305 [Chloroflexi bacterium B3_Chlor]
MLGWRDIVAQQERYKDLLREAERHRLVLHELALHERKNRFGCRAMAWLGRALVAWGWRLQERYAARLEVPAFPGGVTPPSVMRDGCDQAGNSC